MFKGDVCFDWLAARQSLEAAPILPQTQGWGAVIGPNRSNLNQTGKWAVKSAPVQRPDSSAMEYRLFLAMKFVPFLI